MTPLLHLVRSNEIRNKRSLLFRLKSISRRLRTTRWRSRMRSSKSSMRTSLRCSTRLDILKHTSSSPMWKSAINWVPSNTEGHLPLTWVFLLRSELLIEMVTNMRLLSTQLLRPETEGVEEDTSLQKE
ncbi:hypothetical protein ACFX2F_047097 [Malus domestica]